MGMSPSAKSGVWPEGIFWDFLARVQGERLHLQKEDGNFKKNILAIFVIPCII